MYFAHRLIAYHVQWGYVARLFLSAAAMAGTAWFAYHGLLLFLGNTGATLAAISAAGAIYILCLFLFRAVAADDLRCVPVIGAKVSSLLSRL